MDELSYQILPARFSQASDRELYAQAYATFKETWLSTFVEIFGQDYAYASNDFTRQDWIQCLFLDRECVALNCVREINLGSQTDLDDSWLKPWPRAILDGLKFRGGDRCLINSYFTVRADHRKTLRNEKYSFSYILGCLSVLEQLELEVPTMLGMMRNNRSMNTLGAQWGSETLESNVIHNTIPSDLVLFESKKVIEASKNFPGLVFDLFNHKNQFGRKGAQNESAA